MKRDLRGMTLPEVAEALKAMGQPTFGPNSFILGSTRAPVMRT